MLPDSEVSDGKFGLRVGVELDEESIAESGEVSLREDIEELVEASAGRRMGC